MKKAIKDLFTVNKKKAVTIMMAALAVVCGAISASADEVAPAFPITSNDLSAVSTNINSAISAVVPVGLGVMAVLLGVYLVPKLIKRFIK